MIRIGFPKSGSQLNDHFALQRKKVEIGSNTKRKVADYKLSRYACYLVAQNDKAE